MPGSLVAATRIAGPSPLGLTRSLASFGRWPPIYLNCPCATGLKPGGLAGSLGFGLGILNGMNWGFYVLDSSKILKYLALWEEPLPFSARIYDQWRDGMPHVSNQVVAKWVFTAVLVSLPWRCHGIGSTSISSAVCCCPKAVITIARDVDDYDVGSCSLTKISAVDTVVYSSWRRQRLGTLSFGVGPLLSDDALWIALTAEEIGS